MGWLVLARLLDGCVGRLVGGVMSKPIPARLRKEFFAFMQARDNDKLPDGAWFAVLEESAEEFCKKHHLKWADRNDAAHQYIQMFPTPETAK